MKQDNKWIGKTILFLTGLAVLLYTLSVTLSPKGYNVYNEPEASRALERIADEKENTIDVIFAGNSECADGFSPLQVWGETGVSSQNIGYPMQRLGDTYNLLEQIIKTQHPKVLVLEADALFNKAEVIEDDDKYLETAERIFPILHYHQVYRKLKPKSIRMTKKIGDALYKGFWIKEGVIPYQGDQNYYNTFGGSETDFNLDAKKYLLQIEQLCKDNDIDLVLASMVAPWNYNMAKRDVVTKWCNENGYDFVDMNAYTSEIGIDFSTDFLDGGAHLNFNGTKKTNSWFANYLREHDALEDHRGDSRYDSWQSAYEESGLYGGVN